MSLAFSQENCALLHCHVGFYQPDGSCHSGIGRYSFRQGFAARAWIQIDSNISRMSASGFFVAKIPIAFMRESIRNLNFGGNKNQAR